MCIYQDISHAAARGPGSQLSIPDSDNQLRGVLAPKGLTQPASQRRDFNGLVNKRGLQLAGAAVPGRCHPTEWHLWKR